MLRMREKVPVGKRLTAPIHAIRKTERHVQHLEEQQKGLQKQQRQTDEQLENGRANMDKIKATQKELAAQVAESEDEENFGDSEIEAG